MAIGEHQVKTTNNSFIDAKGSGTISFYVDRPNATPAKPAKIVSHMLFICLLGVLITFLALSG
jgi:hypothetical protein